MRAPAVPATTVAAAKGSSSGTRVLYTALLAIALAALVACAVIWVVQAIGAASQVQAQLGSLDPSTALYGSVLFVALPGIVSLLALFGVFPVITALGDRHVGTRLPKRATTIAVLLAAVPRRMRARPLGRSSRRSLPQLRRPVPGHFGETSEEFS